MYRCLLPSSVTVKMDYKENMENVCYATNDDTPLWLNHLVLLYKECNCKRIMSLYTYNKNVDIIWHYCIISQIKLQIWRQTRWSIWSIDYDVACYIYRLLYGICHITCHINPRPILALGSSTLGLIWASRVDMTCDMTNAI
jgi:hypothetical protein